VSGPQKGPWSTVRGGAVHGQAPTPPELTSEQVLSAGKSVVEIALRENGLQPGTDHTTLPVEVLAYVVDTARLPLQMLGIKPPPPPKMVRDPFSRKPRPNRARPT